MYSNNGYRQMIEIYYYMKKHPECKTVSEAKRILHSTNIHQLENESSEMIAMVNDDEFILRGIRKKDIGKINSNVDAIEEVASNASTIRFVQTEEKGLEIEVLGKKTDAQLSLNLLRYLLHREYETHSENKINYEIDGTKTIISVEEQKEFLKKLEEALEEKTIIKGAVGSIKKRNVPTVNEIVEAIGSISSTLPETYKEEELDKLHSEIRKMSRITMIKETAIGDEEYDGFDRAAIFRHLNNLVNVDQLKKVIEKYNSKVEELESVTSVPKEIIEKMRLHISSLREELRTTNENIEKFDVAFSKMMETSSEVEKLETLKKVYEDIKKRCQKRIRNLENDNIIPEKEKSEKIICLKIIINGCDSKINSITKRIEELGREESGREEHIGDTQSSYNVEENYTDGSGETAKERSAEEQDVTNNKTVKIHLNYNRLKFWDRYRAKISAYKLKNGKFPNIFQRIRLLFPSEIYSTLASAKIADGTIPLFDKYDEDGKLIAKGVVKGNPERKYWKYINADDLERIIKESEGISNNDPWHRAPTPKVPEGIDEEVYDRKGDTGRGYDR